MHDCADVVTETPQQDRGTSVSGCVRATIADAFMRDIPCMVIRDGAADRTTAVLEANLFDLHQKYVEVISLTEALAFICG